ncbi:glycosyltransferase family 4 protein [Anoxybacterium hadale]|uniref:Glycosyltransferase family 4 protein n=2 Tax=Anoxybacterium hadale TaxID=3408580 RepID=A0ACD1AI48_9FIRM|nr:glycosyltransferase family 4 protein [Clostridiales bacterium]
MVMNREDLAIAQKYRLCRNREHIYCTNGMGIDLALFHPMPPSEEQRKAFGLKDGDFTLVYAAEFSKRKNHRLLLQGFAKALQELQVQESQLLQKSQQLQELQGLQNSNGIQAVVSSRCARLILVLAGDGALLEEMKALAKDLGISEHVNFLGYVTDMQALYSCCQAAVSTSRIEGLPFHVMEAIGCGLPVIASDIKGHRELIAHQKNGLLFERENAVQLASGILELYNSPLLEDCKVNGSSSMKMYSIDNVLPSIMQIYHKHISTWGGMKE